MIEFTDGRLYITTNANIFRIKYLNGFKTVSCTLVRSQLRLTLEKI